MCAAAIEHVERAICAGACDGHTFYGIRHGEQKADMVVMTQEVGHVGTIHLVHHIALKGKGSDTEAHFTADNIVRLTPHFRFASSMRKALERKNLQFEKFNWVRPAEDGE